MRRLDKSIDWKSIQKEINKNKLEWKDVRNKYDIPNSQIGKAVDANVIKFKNFHKKKYSFETLSEAVRKSNSYSEIFRRLNITVNGGSYSWLQKTIKDYNLNIDHFKKELFGGKRPTGKIDYSLLQELPNTGIRKRSKVLKAFLESKGVEYKCKCCGLSEWLGEKIRLDVDHADGDCLNNHIDNLRFLCPNCHRQKTIKVK